MTQNRNDGPPDLDEIVRKFNQKLSALFGGGKRPTAVGSGGATPIRPQVFGGGLALIIGVVLAVWLATGFYIVEEGKRGVELRLGKYSATTLPGPRWHWPYPFESHELVNLSAVRTVEVGYRNSQKSKMGQEALMLTKDENIVDVQFAVQYDVKDPEDFLFSNRFTDQEALEFVRQVSETAIREIVGKSEMDFVLNEGRSEISVNVQRLMQVILDRYKSGIQVRAVTMQNAQPPEQVQSAFDDAVRAGQDREKFKNDGEAYRNSLLPQARGEAAKLIEEASAHRSRVVAQAEGDGARFRQVLAEYEKAPVVTRERLYLETIQQIMANSTKVMIDQKAGNNLISLPLERLLQGGAASTAVAPNDANVPRVVESPPAGGASSLTTTETVRPGRENIRARESR
jgi:modulator of FtsH protease HflK